MKQTKRTLVSLLLVFAMLATCLVAFSVTGTAAGEPDVWDGSTYTEPTQLDSDGTTILVTTAEEFAWITKNPASATNSYRLTTDFDMNAKTPSSNADTYKDESGKYVTDPSGIFSGTLDGDGHYVRNIKDNGGWTMSCLFPRVTGTIKNLTIKDSTFYASNNASVAVFAGVSLEATGVLENCHVVDCIICGRSASGLVRYAAGTIRNCTVKATISTNDETQDHTVGGICQSLPQATGSGAVIENCTVSGTITATNYGSKTLVAGGLIGSVVIGWAGWKWTLKNCVNNATITVADADGATSSVSVGGLIGQSARDESNAGEGALTLTNCVNNGNISVTSSNAYGVGGLVGRTKDGTLKAIDCVNNGEVSAPAITNVGGFIGQNGHTATASKINYGTNIFQNCGQYGAVTGAANVGGAVGYTYKNTTLDNVVLAGSVNLSTSAAEGALIGTVIGCQTATTENDKTLADSTLTMTNVYSPLTAALYNTDTAATGTLNVTSTSVVTGDAFTSGTIADFVTALNDAATANSWHEWAAAAAPLYIVFKGDAVQVTLDGATLALGDTMTLKLFVKASSVAEIADLATIMVNDGTTDYAGALDATAENYVFEIAGLAAKDMGTAKTYTVKYTLASDTANPIVCDTGVTYSPLQYAINMYQKNNGTDAKFAALLTSMVRYMDAAGASDAMTTFASATGYVFGDTTDAYTAIVNKDKDSTYTLTSETAELGAELTSGIILLVNPAEGLTLTSVKIGTDELTITNVEGVWRVTGINPGDLYNELTFTFTTAEGTVTGTYSIARYLNSYVGTASETLAKATALYMDAFITYKTIG